MSSYFKSMIMAVITMCSVFTADANAAWLGLPATFKGQVDKIALLKPVLAPFAYSRFCVRYSDDCRVHGIFFRRPKPVLLDERHVRDIVEINRSVNRRIIPTRYTKPDFYNSWSINPQAGDCNDFAVTKRHELMTRGWPSRALLLAEVVTPQGEHHMILVVRTRDRDLVMDNLSASVRPWSSTPYRWVRVQSPFNPSLWSSIGGAPTA